LLFAPGFAYLFYWEIGLLKSFLYALFFVAIQVIVGYPFLVHNASHYIQKAFEFDRKFLYEWTVNWRMIPEKYFADSEFSHILLSMHVITLIICAIFLWTRYRGYV
jgi:alpha-1,3-mannosyltransferase